MKDKDPFGIESLIIWNAALISGFILIISVGSIVPLFNNTLSSPLRHFAAEVQ